MKILISIALACCSCLAASAFNLVANDSVKATGQTTQQAEKAKLVYPVLKEIAGNDDIIKKINSLHFDEARKLIDTKIRQSKRRKDVVAAMDVLQARCTEGINALNGTDRVIIVDSVVIDKAIFLDAYGITPDLGSLTMSANGETVNYKAQLNGMELLVENSPLQIVRRYSDDNSEKPQVVEGLDVDGDINYPFLLPDGQRFYFAARSSGGYGNYDLYATRYDNASKRFYRAENMGFPYNSYANDYMLVIDDVNGLGWFASDRYQPEGKVCVYTFIPHESRTPFADSELTRPQLICAASLNSIKTLQSYYTDEEKGMINEAKRAIAALTLTAKSSRKSDFEFVVNNKLTYNSINDFKSAKARQLCKQWQQCVSNLASLRSQLDEMRDNASKNAKKIEQSEQRILTLTDDANMLAKKIRQEETGGK